MSEQAGQRQKRGVSGSVSCRVEYYCVTDVGVRRSHNQDAYMEQVASNEETWIKQGHLFLVADGMGAHAVGELASEKAAKIIPHTFSKYAEAGPAQALYRAYQEANQAIFQLGNQNIGFAGTGTTATTLVLHPSGAWIAHVGDTRIYRVRGGQIEQLTYDHSLRWEVARRRGQDPEKVTDVASNAIVRSLGPDVTVQVDIEGPHPIQAGDIYVLCSDGLSGLVTDAEIGAIASTLDVQQAAQFLVALANLRGGPDNITVIVARVLEYRNAQSGSKPSWRQRLLEVWRRQPVSIRLACASIPLALLCLMTVLWLLWSLYFGRRNPSVLVSVAAASSFTLAAALLLASWYLSRKPESDSEESESAGPSPLVVRPGHVYRSCRCEPDASLFDRMVQVQRHLYELIHEAGWPYRKEEHQRFQQESQRLLREGNLAAAFRSELQALAVLADTARRHQQRQEVFLPNWDSDHVG